MRELGFQKPPASRENRFCQSILISPLRNSEFSHASQPSTRGTSSAATLRISETFTSLQGEGGFTGTESYFIRTSGCNLRCWFCDTPYASWKPTGEHKSVDQIVQSAVDSGLSHVVLTGGEPMLTPDSVGLAKSLRAAGLHLTIETAGTIDRDIQCDLMSISPKLQSSTPDATEHPRWNELHEARRLPINVMRGLIDRAKQFQIKFVVDSPADYDEVNEIVAALGVAPGDVWIMPQGSTIEAMDASIEWLKPWTNEQGYVYCDRLQIRWFGNRRGT